MIEASLNPIHVLPSGLCEDPSGEAAALIERMGKGDHGALAELHDLWAPVFLGIAKDNRSHLMAKLEEGRDCDITVAIGGASVGDHDLVGPVLQELGLRLDFWRIAMRPGKPLMYGRLEAGRRPRHVLGLPGNPVSPMICSRIFLVPLIHALLGLPEAVDTPRDAVAGKPMSANGPREHYMRATLAHAADGSLIASPVRSQDSSLLTPLAAADALIVRPPNDPAKAQGDPVRVLPLDF